jgi:acyl dehydratase
VSGKVRHLDPSVIGREFDRTEFGPVTAEQIIRYARACGETDPIYTDEAAAAAGPHGGLVGSPTFPVTVRREVFLPKEVPDSFGYDGFDAGKDIDIGAPVRPGDVLTSSTTIHETYEKTGRSGSMVFLVLRTVVTNQRGELVATMDQRMMFRPPNAERRSNPAPNP